jgi:hypothetical protein
VLEAKRHGDRRALRLIKSEAESHIELEPV